MEREYQPTIFDRYGADAALGLRAAGYGLMVFGLVTGVVIVKVGFHWWTLPMALIGGSICAGVSWWLSENAGKAWKTVLVDGASTPSVEQYSYQDSLIMRGEIDEAIASFEAIATAHPGAVTPRVKAAELYIKERQNYQRAAELFREAQRSSAISSGEDIYIANRLADLYAGPLGERGRALIELRRVIDRHHGTPAAGLARRALRDLKGRPAES